MKNDTVWYHLCKFLNIKIVCIIYIVTTMYKKICLEMIPTLEELTEDRGEIDWWGVEIWLCM